MADDPTLATMPPTGGAWVPVPNPLGGAPVAEYKRDDANSPGEIRPIGGVSLDQLSGSDVYAFQLQMRMTSGASLQEAMNEIPIFKGPTTVVQTGSGPVPVSSLDPDTQAIYAAQDQQNATTAIEAIEKLQTGVLDATRNPSLGAAQPPATTTTSNPPASTPVITAATAAAAQTIAANGLANTDPVLRVPPVLVPGASPSSGATNTANSSTDGAPATAPSAATSVTGGSVTAAALGAQTNASSASSAGSWIKYAAIGVAVILGLLVFFHGGAS